MKKTLLTILGILFAPFSALAADSDPYGLNTTADKAGIASRSSLPQTVGNVISVALGLTGTIFLVLMIYGGIIWMQARGHEEHVTKAKEIIWSAVIGLIIIGAAYALTNFIVARIGSGA